MRKFTLRLSRKWRSFIGKGSFTFLLFFLGCACVQSQVATYVFSSGSQTYTPITGGTIIKDGTATLDSYVSGAITIPSFTFGGVAYTTAYVTSNGLLNLGGAAPSTTSYTAISTTTGSGISICPFNADLNRAVLTAASEIRWEDLTGTSNEIVFQWTQFQRYNATESFDFQVRLNTTSGDVKFIYKLNSGPGISTSYQPQVGIRTSATDFKNRMVTTLATEDWATSVTGAANTSLCRFTSTSPAKGFATGLTYTFSPPVPCTGAPVAGATAQSTYYVCNGSTQVLAVLGGAVEGPGIGYQWEQSADGITGWGNVSGGTGATTTSYTTVAYAGTSPYYRMKTTCSNSGLSATTPVVTLAGPAVPATQASAFTTSSLTVNTATLSWTNGNGNNRSVYINSTNSFTDPVAPNSPGTAATVWANAGQQLVYDGTGSSVAITGLAGATTYYVRVYENQKCAAPTAWYYNTTTATNNPGNFTTVAPPVNDNCAGAILVPVNPTLTCTDVVSGTVLAATASAGPVSTCGTYDDDVWFKFVATSATHIITLQNLAGSTTDLTFQVMESCGATTALICSDPQSAAVNGLIPGNTYYLRVATWTSTGLQTSTFDVCIGTPGPMSYVSSTTTQSSTSTVVGGSVNQQIIRVAVVVDGATSPLSLTQLDFNTNSTTNPMDIDSARVYFTGSSTTFSTTTQFGTTIANPNGAFTATGTQVLSGGVTNTTNYFWLVYDISCAATGANVVDAECTSIDVNGAQTPTVSAPVGTRAILAASYTATTSQPLTSVVAQGSVDVQVLRVALTGCANNPVTAINFTTTGTTDAGNDVIAARVYYTTTTVFSTAVQFGSVVANPNGGFTVTGSQNLTLGTGYFWLVYDLSPTATATNLLDASCENATINGNTATPTTANPTGTRTIIAAITNDDAPNAALLSVGAGCAGPIYNNIGATKSTNEVYPSCSGTAQAPVWFKFIAPASGAVRVSSDLGTIGTCTDTKVGLFSATNVNDYSTFSIISCDDDGGSALGSGFLSVLYATGLTPGATYYVAVDLYSSSSTQGTFCIAVDELAETMLSANQVCGSSVQSPASNSSITYTGWVPLMDASSKLVALVKNSAGGSVSLYSFAQTITAGASRVDGIGLPYLNRNFFINNSGTVPTADVQFFFTNAELASLGVTLTDLNVSRVSGTACVANFQGSATLLSQTASGSANGANWVKVTTPGFSNFYLHQGYAALPVTVVYFNGRTTASGNQLSWKVNCTSTNINFEIERSNNGRSYASIGKLGATQARCLTPFDFADAKPATGVNYYRLKIIDVDGQVTYTNVVAINNKTNGITMIGVQPTLVQSGAILYIAAAKTGKLQIAVTDMVGRQLQTHTINVVEGDNKVNLHFGSLAPGVYNITSINESVKSTIRFVKQ